MVELSPQQIDLLKRLFAAGYRPIAIPPYESALCIHRGECAALLTPVEGAGLRLLSPPTFLVNGNLGVRIKRTGGDVFVWKHSEVEATPERLEELKKFASDLEEILREGPKQ
jgi:hypothetical protein